MAPHPPPCSSSEVNWGGVCYPRIDTIHVGNVGDTFGFVLGNVSSDLLPHLAEAAGDGAHMVVSKGDSGFNVTIASVSRDNAIEMLNRLQPSDPTSLLD